MSVAVRRRERRVNRPTSANVVYDVRDVSSYSEPPFIHVNFRTPLARTSRTLFQMLSWQEDWNGYGAAKPNPVAILKALHWIEHVRLGVTRRHMPWREPHAVADANGHVVFEWSCDNRTLSIYVSPGEIEYLRSSGPDIYSDMEDGDIVVLEDILSHYRWLIGQE